MKYYLLTLLAAASLFADGDEEQRLAELEARFDEIAVKNQWRTIGAQSPPSRPAEYKDGWHVGVDFLYWKAEEAGLEYAIDQGEPENNPGTITTGEILDLHFKWQPGSRVWLGYNLPYDSWDAVISWTHLTSRPDTSTHLPVNGALTALWSPLSAESISFCGRAEGDWDLHYNVVDLELGRDFFVSRNVSIRPFMGPRGAWLIQKILYRYSGADFLLPMTIKMGNGFAGGGLRAGFDLDWHMNKNWAIFSTCSGALVYGRFKLSQNVMGVNAAFPVVAITNILDVAEILHATRGNVEINIGLLWEKYFSKNKYHLMMSLAYEFSEWFHQNHMIEFLALQQSTAGNNGQFTPHNGDLGLHGGTFALHYDF